jgi:hypothetical protein
MQRLSWTVPATSLRIVIQAALPLFMLLQLGCAEPKDGVVSGMVKVDGEPAKSGSIAFFPVSGKGKTAGATIADGAYTAHVPFGEAKVEIRVSKVVGQKKLYDTPDSPTKPLLAEVLPPKYNDQTTLTINVQRGENHQDFDLQTK